MAFTNVEQRDAELTGLSLSLAVSSGRWRSLGFSSSHTRIAGSLGGGTVGFDGQLALSHASGLRLELGDSHGPFVRTGIRGQIGGNRRLYTSFLELPHAEAGYQYLDDRWMLEVGARTGVVLAGRYNPTGEGHHRLGRSLEFSGYVALSIAQLRLEASVMRVDRAGDRRPVDVGRVDACLWPGASYAVCFDGQWLRIRRDDATTGESYEVPSSYAGLLFGIRIPE
ncbi:MAG: hypothetical protein EOO75_21205 [Myxococcales bacterium]|nr:MAG: hypothetical protein EOO75_21205 [Myxococcales bacterium]